MDDYGSGLPEEPWRRKDRSTKPYAYVNELGVTIHVWFDPEGQEHRNAAGALFDDEES